MQPNQPRLPGCSRLSVGLFFLGGGGGGGVGRWHSVSPAIVPGLPGLPVWLLFAGYRGGVRPRPDKQVGYASCGVTSGPVYTQTSMFSRLDRLARCSGRPPRDVPTGRPACWYLATGDLVAASACPGTILWRYYFRSAAPEVVYVVVSVTLRCRC